MRNSIIAIAALFLSISMFASNEPIDRLDKQVVKEMSADQRMARISVLEERVSVIQDIDMKSLERSERKQVKGELQYIQHEMKAHTSGGIYISSGALVIIIILLIIL